MTKRDPFKYFKTSREIIRLVLSEELGLRSPELAPTLPEWYASGEGRLSYLMAPRLRPLLTPQNDGTQKENRLDLRVAPRIGAGHRGSPRRHAISRSLLTRWRREARQGRLSAPESEMHFAPVAITANADQRAETERGDARSGRFEIVLQNGPRLLADAPLEASALARLVQILERA